MLSKKERLDLLVSHYANGNKAAFSRQIGITKQSLNTWYKNEYIDIEKLFFACTGVSAEWLLTGEGEMLTKNRPVGTPSEAIKTQEDKELLLKDLCARLPYKVKVSILGGGPMELQACIYSSVGWYFDIKDAPTDFGLDEIKPYLRPMSSMTKEEREEFRMLGGVMSYSPQHNTWAISAFSPEAYDWLNKKIFDFRGFIEKGLALKAIEGMYN